MPNTNVTKKDLNKVLRRSFALQACFSPERMQNTGFCYSMLPVLKKLYQKKEDLIQAMKRHLEYFNVAAAFAPFILGVTVAMEEERAEKGEEEVSDEMINAVKTSLMGPLAGIGDSLFWGTFRIIGLGIGAPLAKQGYFLGVILYILVNVIPSMIVRVGGFSLGYKEGIKVIGDVSESGLFERITEAAKVMGLVMVGAMIVDMVWISTPIELTFGETTLVLQEALDQIFPYMLPLLMSFGCYHLVKKNYNTLKILIGLVIFGLILGGLGIIA